ncbi:hypothetical protein XCY_000381 [Xanthomonas arboricola pv. juglandis]|uniref:hypothetical protein n=1 Tax=Xanthomonas arboricola TaxID=56448 RepID=UPI001AFBB3BC|nr:hypothetical protein [Xanthomonas arboricola]CAG2083421.1 hypothetical protein XCY_000381 [Xanthomonas arboricola pv. juglandis]
MKNSVSRFQGKSFGWGFILFIRLFSASAFWGESVGLSKLTAAILFGVSGFIPFLIQAFTGCALDGAWVARFSRREHPTKYWLLLALSAAIGIGFSYDAYSTYMEAAHVAA